MIQAQRWLEQTIEIKSSRINGGFYIQSIIKNAAVTELLTKLS